MTLRLCVLSLFALVLPFAGCRTALIRETPEPVCITESLRLDPAPLAEALRVRPGLTLQTVTGTWQDHAFAAEIVMKGDGTRFTAVCLAPHMRLVTLTITPPHTLRYECAPHIPRAFQPEYILTDLAFVNLDTATLQRALAPHLTVSDDGVTRRISAGQRLIADITRAPDGAITFRHHIHQYTYELRARTP